jgi:hypothetical protein
LLFKDNYKILFKSGEIVITLADRGLTDNNKRQFKAIVLIDREEKLKE